MKYRQIKTDFWEDGYVLELSAQEKNLFIFLFTNDKVNLTGIYELPDRIICTTLGLTLGELEEMKARFQKDNKYAFYKGWIYIINFAEHNKYSTAKPVVESFLKDFRSIPEQVLQYFFSDLGFTFTPAIENYKKVIVMVMVMVKYGRPYPRLEANINDIDPNDIPENL